MDESSGEMKTKVGNWLSEVGTAKAHCLFDQDTLQTKGVALGRIDQYELLRELGGGGFGMVYLARDTVAGIEVAVKGLPPLVRNIADELECIRENFALVSKLHHPHIAAALVLHPAKEVTYADESVRQALRVLPNDYLLVMAYAPGVTLSKWRKQFAEGKVPVAQALEVCRQIAEALDYAHGEKVVHRDVKPSNVMVETRGRRKNTDDRNRTEENSVVWVLDFGLAAEIRSSLSRVSLETGDTSGTRPYMAPEQWAGFRQDGRTDQYALAALFYELVSGSVPFASAFNTADPVIMANAALNMRPEPLKCLSKTQNLALLRALSKKPEQRFPSCGVFVAALGTGVGTAMKGLRIVWLALVAPVAVTLAGLAYVVYFSHKPPASLTAKPLAVATSNTLTEAPTVTPPKPAPDPAEEVALRAVRVDAEIAWEQAKKVEGSELAFLDERKREVDRQWRLGVQSATDNDKAAARVAFTKAKELGELLLADFSRAEKSAAETHDYLTSKSAYAEASMKEDAALLTTYGGAAWDEVQRLAREGEASASDPVRGKHAYVGAQSKLVEAVKEAKAAKAAAEREALLKVVATPIAQAVTVVKSAAKAVPSSQAEVRPPVETAPQPGGPKVGEPFVLELDGGFRIAFVYIRSGNFVMGSNEGDEDERPAHSVSISKGFWLARTEVTRGVYCRVMNAGGALPADADVPVERVSWTDASQFCRLLRQYTVGRLAECFTFRLPTEAEWEYACRAGTSGRFFFDGGLPALGKYAWYRQNSHGRIQPVGGREPNPWGLCDMLGSVSEWCSDWYDAYPGLQTKNRFMGKTCHVLRGGDYTSASALIACSGRTGAEPEEHSDGVGFRFVLGGK